MCEEGICVSAGTRRENTGMSSERQVNPVPRRTSFQGRLVTSSGLQMASDGQQILKYVAMEDAVG